MSYYAKRFFGQQGIVTDGLKLWLDASNPLSYPGTGTLWSDLSGNGNNGTMINGVTYNAANGGVMSFDGVNDYVNTSNISQLDYNSPMTISAWINPTNFTSFRAIISNSNPPTSHRGVSLFATDTGAMQFSLRNDIGGATINLLGVNSPTNSLISNQYQMVTVTYDGSSSSSGVKMYINGQLVENTIVFNSLSATILSAIPFRVGSRALGNYFLGAINEPLIYNRALTAEEVNINFQATRNKYGI